MKKDYGLSAIRRSNEDGHHYFISALTDRDTDGWHPLDVNATLDIIFHPLAGANR